MSTALYDSIARIARHEARTQAMAGVGQVTELFVAPGSPADHAVSVRMRDTGMVLPRVPIAVGMMGFAVIPAVDELVVVLFMDGDFSSPVVVGRLYHHELDPPEHAEGEVVLRLPAGSESPKLSMVIKGDEPSIHVEMPEDVAIDVTPEKVLIKAGEMSVSVETSGGGRAELMAGGSVITLKKDGDVTISAKGKLKLEGSEIEIAGAGSVKVTGAKVDIN